MQNPFPVRGGPTWFNLSSSLNSCPFQPKPSDRGEKSGGGGGGGGSPLGSPLTACCRREGWTYHHGNGLFCPPLFFFERELLPPPRPGIQARPPFPLSALCIVTPGRGVRDEYSRPAGCRWDKTSALPAFRALHCHAESLHRAHRPMGARLGRTKMSFI